MEPISFSKQPWEKRQLEFDLTDSLATGDSVASIVGVTVWEGTIDRSASMISNPTLVGNKIYAVVQGGRSSKVYWLRLRAHTTNQDLIEDDLKVMVKEKGEY